MAVKSVLDIDVNDESFKRFTDLFGKYRDSLANQPDMWKRVGKESDKAGESFADIAATLLAMNSLTKENAEQMDKSNGELSHHASLWKSVHRSTTGVLRNVGDIAKWLTRMGIDLGLGAVGTGIAGLFGLLEMSKGVTDKYIGSLATGTSIGQREAFERFQGTYLGGPGAADRFLSNVLLGQTPANAAQFSAMSVLGVHPSGNVYSDADRFLKALQERAKTMPKDKASMLLAQMPFLSSMGVTPEILQTLQTMSRRDLQQAINAGNANVGRLGMSAAAGRNWTVFGQSIGASWASMITQLENAISGSGLLKPLQRIMNTFSNDVDKLLRSPLAKAALTDVANALDRFANYIARGSFTNDIEKFGNDVKEFATAVQHTGFAIKATAGVFTSPVQSTKTAFDYYQNQLEMFGMWLGGGFSPGKSSAAPASVNVKTSHQVIIRNQTGGNAAVSVNNLHGGTP